MIDEAEVAVLLGRSLTAIEEANFATYLDKVTKDLEGLLCFPLTLVSDESGQETVATEKTFDARPNYTTLWTPPFSTLTSVTIDGEEVDVEDYTAKQNDSYEGTWFNNIVFDSKLTEGRVIVEAAWGFTAFPSDLKMLLAKMFDQNSVSQNPTNVKSKEVEDFKVTYKDEATMDDLLSSYASTIARYSLCNVGEIQSGRHGIYPFYE